MKRVAPVLPQINLYATLGKVGAFRFRSVRVAVRGAICRSQIQVTAFATLLLQPESIAGAITQQHLAQGKFSIYYKAAFRKCGCQILSSSTIKAIYNRCLLKKNRSCDHAIK